MSCTVLVTGGAGYIGAHAVRELQQHGYGVIILDNLSCGHQDFVEKAWGAQFIEGDISDRSLLDHIFKTHHIQAVMHFAAYAYVGESVKNPAKYYRNNVVGSLTLLEAMVAAGVKHFIFSSTCATYGVPDEVPIFEESPQNPINPYGQSKLMVERIVEDFGKAYGLGSICFRYFNAAGAHPDGDLGEDHDPEPHLIPKILYSALGKSEGISIFGTDYPTPDGTCIRDYVHVVDLARAHVMGLDYILAGGATTSFNLGTGHGFSVKEIVDAARTVTGQQIDCVLCDRRSGDPPVLIADASKASEVLGWQPLYSDLNTILAHAWAWHQKRHSLPDRKMTSSSSPKDMPLVSVIIPAYNAEKFIERTLTTVLNQTYSNIEVLVVDDGSTDSTPDIVKSFADNDARVILLQQANAGVAAARNYAIAESKGDFIAPIDADDILHKTNIEKQVQLFMESDDHVGMVYSWSLDIDEEDHLTGGVRMAPYSGNIYPAMLIYNVIGHASGCMIRRSCLEHIGSPYYKPEFLAQKAQGCEDWDIYLRIAENYQVGLVPEFLIGYRQVQGSMSRQLTQMERSRELALQPIKEKFPNIYKCVSQWCFSMGHMNSAGQNLKAYDYPAAWSALFKAFQTDMLTTLTKYASWVILFRLIKVSLVSFVLSTTQLRRERTESSSVFKIYRQIILNYIFPAWLIQTLRIHWLNAKISPHRDVPKTQSFWKVKRMMFDIQMRFRQGDSYVDFGQNKHSHISKQSSVGYAIDCQSVNDNVLDLADG